MPERALLGKFPTGPRLSLSSSSVKFESAAHDTAGSQTGNLENPAFASRLGCVHIIPLMNSTMLQSDHTVPPLGAHDERSLFLDRAWNVGRAYRNQALRLISLCQLISRIASPTLSHEDAELKR